MHFPQDFAIQKNLTPFISLKFNLKKIRIHVYTLQRFPSERKFSTFFQCKNLNCIFLQKAYYYEK